MLADFYIPKLSNEMKIAVQKNHLGGQILYRRLDSSKKTASKLFFAEQTRPQTNRPKRQLDFLSNGPDLKDLSQKKRYFWS